MILNKVLHLFKNSQNFFKPNFFIGCDSGMSHNANIDSQWEPPLLPVGTTIGNFEIIQLIGEGGYGQIYEVLDHNNRTPYAMKIEYLTTRKKGLQFEIKVLKECNFPSLFPALIDSGRTTDFRFYVMELLGPSLSKICTILPDNHLTKYTLLHVGVHMIECISSLHSKGYIHRDIKPGNFLIRPDRDNPLCFIDFGLARKYLTETGEIKPPRENPGYTGTTRYASINAHDEKELGRRDDLFSWFYSMIELSVGSLPWPGSQDEELTIKMKKEMTPEELCTSLPPVFIDIYKMIQKLSFEDEPDYLAIINLLKQAIKDANFVVHHYDWEKLSISELDKISSIRLVMDYDTSGIYQVENGCCQVF